MRASVSGAGSESRPMVSPVKYIFDDFTESYICDDFTESYIYDDFTESYEIFKTSAALRAFRDFFFFFFFFFLDFSGATVSAATSSMWSDDTLRRPAVALGVNNPVHKKRKDTRLITIRIGIGTGCRRQIKGSFLSNQRFQWHALEILSINQLVEDAGVEAEADAGAGAESTSQVVLTVGFPPGSAFHIQSC